MNGDNRKILQDLTVTCRQETKDELKIDNLNKIRNLQSRELVNFQLLCCKKIFNNIIQKTSLKPRVIKMYITPDHNSYCIIVGGYIIDGSIDYYVPTKSFAMRINDYPLKIIRYEIITDSFIQSHSKNNIRR